MRKRFFSILLTLCMVLCLAPTAAFAEGRTASADITGSGAADDPYLIYTAAGLKAFRDKVNGQIGLMNQPDAHAKLMNDIVLNDGTFDADGNYTKGASSKDAEEWTPIGNDSTPYSGTFDGNGKTIKGLYVKDQQYAGLFGYVMSRTEGDEKFEFAIRNLTVTGYIGINTNSDTAAHAGGIVGRADILAYDDNVSGTISGCVSYVVINARNTDDNSTHVYAGGMVGCVKLVDYNNHTGNMEITNCANHAAITAYSKNGQVFAGGIVGQIVVDNSCVQKIDACFNAGRISGGNDNFYSNCVGGIIGLASSSSADSSIDSCLNVGEVIGVKGNIHAGGIAGNVNIISISNCCNAGKVGGNGGGIAKYVNGATVSNCYYLEGTADMAYGGNPYKYGLKAKAEFADGTVLGLLKQNDPNSAWDMCGYVEAADMTLPLLEWQTRNARKYDIYIFGRQITSLNQKDVLGDGTVSFVYDEANGKGILTLNGFRPDSSILYGEPIGALMANLEIVLMGENRIETTDSYCISAVNLTFSGNGSIELSTDDEMVDDCVHCSKAFTVDGGNIKIRSVKKALYLRGALTVNGGTLELISTRHSALDIGNNHNNFQVNLDDDRIMITGTNPDGSGAQVTAASDTHTVDWVNYIKIFNKYIPITYEPGQYGTGDAVTENKTYGEDFGLSNVIFARTGYRQTAWTTAENGGEILRLGSAYSGNESLTLYPVWEMEQYDITYDLGGGTVASNPDSYTVESESFTLKNPAKDGGYEFAGWSGTGLTGTDNKTVTVTKGSTGDREYTAHWRDIQAPTVGGLENGKTYCSAVEFTAADNDGIASVTVNAAPLQAENGKYTLTPARGKQTVVVTDKEGNKTTVVVTVNDGHTGGTATCTDKAKCEVCGAEYGEPDAKNHGALKHFDAKAATETAEGNIEYWFCEGCDKYFADKGGTKEITKADTVTAKLPPTPKQPETPKTGDEGHPVLWMTLLVISGGAAAVCRRRRGAK